MSKAIKGKGYWALGYLGLTIVLVVIAQWFYANYRLVSPVHINVQFNSPIEKVLVSPLPKDYKQPKKHSMHIVDQVQASEGCVIDKGPIPDQREYVRTYVLKEAEKRFGCENLQSLDNLMMGESHYNLEALNADSGACGMPQSLPCEKMQDKTLEGQTKWLLNYLENRYGNPNNAYNFWVSQSPHWY